MKLDWSPLDKVFKEETKYDVAVIVSLITVIVNVGITSGVLFLIYMIKTFGFPGFLMSVFAVPIGILLHALYKGKIVRVVKE
jgi:hypothetical protein